MINKRHIKCYCRGTLLPTITYKLTEWCGDVYIKTTKSKGYEYLYLVEDVYEAGRKKKTIMLERLGRADLIAPEVLQSMKGSELKGCRYTVAGIERTLSKVLPSIIGDPETETSEDDKEGSIPSLNYGHLVIKQIWNGTLHLSRFFSRCTTIKRSTRAQHRLKLSTVGYFLCASKVMSPSSYLGLFAQNNAFLANPISSLDLNSIYRSLSYFGRFKDEIMKHTYAAISDELKLDQPKLLFFDCTNFYFETPYSSKEEFIMDYHKACTLKMINAGASPSEIKLYLQSDEYSKELTAALDKAKEDGELMRMYGLSKDGKSQPLVGMSLVIDEHGFPLDFELYPGNESEFSHLRDSIESIKTKYGITDAFFVADRGLNSGQNLQFIQANKFGFIIAQKVSQQTAKQRAEMLSDEGWKTIDLDKNGDVWARSLFDDEDGALYRYKVCDCTKVVYEKNEEVDDKGKRTTGKRGRKLEVKCKIIYTFSEKRKRRDLLVLDALVAKAQAAIASGQLAKNATGSGWHHLALTSAEVAKNTKDKEQYRYIALNLKKINNLKEIAGYAALVYSPPEGCEGTDSLEITAQQGYKQLVQIEDCFRTAKTNLQLRPVFLKRNDRTKGHCVICILALIILKVIQYNLIKQGQYMSFEKIQMALDQAMVSVLPSAFHDGKALFLNNHRPWQDVAATRKRGKKSNPPQCPVASATTKVIRAAGLQPLQPVELDRGIRLKLKVDPKVTLLSAEQREMLRLLATKMYS